MKKYEAINAICERYIAVTVSAVPTLSHKYAVEMLSECKEALTNIEEKNEIANWAISKNVGIRVTCDNVRRLCDIHDQRITLFGGWPNRESHLSVANRVLIPVSGREVVVETAKPLSENEFAALRAKKFIEMTSENERCLLWGKHLKEMQTKEVERASGIVAQLETEVEVPCFLEAADEDEN